MKELYSDVKKGEKKLKIENIDDLWCLSNILAAGDFIQGKTERKIKLGAEGDRKAWVFLDGNDQRSRSRCDIPGTNRTNRNDLCAL